MTRSKFRKLSISLITVVLLCAVLFGASLPVVADTTQSVEKTDLFELLNIKYSKSELDAKTGTLISKQENFELKMGRFAEKRVLPVNLRTN